MWIIGVDYHPQRSANRVCKYRHRECGERRLNHSDGEAEKFYRELKAAGFSVFKKALDTPNIVRDGRITANLPDVLGRTVQKPVSGNSQISTARE